MVNKIVLRIEKEIDFLLNLYAFHRIQDEVTTYFSFDSPEPKAHAVLEIIAKLLEINIEEL